MQCAEVKCVAREQLGSDFIHVPAERYDKNTLLLLFLLHAKPIAKVRRWLPWLTNTFKAHTPAILFILYLYKSGSVTKTSCGFRGYVSHSFLTDSNDFRSHDFSSSVVFVQIKPIKCC